MVRSDGYWPPFARLWWVDRCELGPPEVDGRDNGLLELPDSSSASVDADALLNDMSTMGARFKVWSVC
jgi:hypothetical protein